MGKRTLGIAGTVLGVVLLIWAYTRVTSLAGQFFTWQPPFSSYELVTVAGAGVGVLLLIFGLVNLAAGGAGISAKPSVRHQPTCPSCGAAAESGSLFCPNCGASLKPAGASSQADTSTATSDRSSTTPWIVGGAAVVVAAFVFAWLYSSGSGSRSSLEGTISMKELNKYCDAHRGWYDGVQDPPQTAINVNGTDENGWTCTGWEPNPHNPSLHLRITEELFGQLCQEQFGAGYHAVLAPSIPPGGVTRWTCRSGAWKER